MTGIHIFYEEPVINCWIKINFKKIGRVKVKNVNDTIVIILTFLEETLISYF